MATAPRAAAPTERHLDRDGCVNVRDLGGLPTRGRVTRRGALVRPDALDRPTASADTDLAALRERMLEPAGG
jgi:protein-tyrosine phosphatase